MLATYAPKTISPKQSAFIGSLLESRITTPDLVAEFTEDMTSSQASKLIDQLKKCPWKNSKPLAKTTPKEIVGEGFYAVMDGFEITYYKVQTSKSSGKRYALRWNGKKFEFAPGEIYKLTAADKMTAEQASQFGHKFHNCVNCQKPLYKAHSQELGYGPDCAEKFGWPY